MEETLVRFTGNTKTAGDSLVFSCVVEYQSILDPFLPQDLKKLTDFDDNTTTVSSFADGRGTFTSCSIERAVELEAEINAKLQTAYQALVDHRELIAKWTGAREYSLDLIGSEEITEDGLLNVGASG